MAPDWPCYRAVLENYVRLDGLDSCSIDDIELMLIAAGAWEDAGKRMREQAQARRKE